MSIQAMLRSISEVLVSELIFLMNIRKLSQLLSQFVSVVCLGKGIFYYIPFENFLNEDCHKFDPGALSLSYYSSFNPEAVGHANKDFSHTAANLSVSDT